jgi:hypothetical protein
MPARRDVELELHRDYSFRVHALRRRTLAGITALIMFATHTVCVCAASGMIETQSRSSHDKHCCAQNETEPSPQNHPEDHATCQHCNPSIVAQRSASGLPAFSAAAIALPALIPTRPSDTCFAIGPSPVAHQPLCRNASGLLQQHCALNL